MSQLTITLDDDLLHAAQVYARQHGQELDALLIDLLQAAVQPVAETPVASATAAEPSMQGFSPRIQRLYGALKAPADFDYKKELEDGLAEKYGV